MIPNVSLEICDLTKIFYPVQALSKINFECFSQDALVLLGPNGAGKTTLLKILSTLLKSTSGSIQFNAKPIYENPSLYKKSIGYAGDKLHLYQDLTIEENLKFFSQIYRIEEKKFRVLEILNEFDLIDHREIFIRKLSKGLQQRTDLARAFLHSPSILLLDEPFTHLDQKSTLKVIENLEKFLSQQGLLVLATHQIDLASFFANRWLVLHQGKMIFQTDKVKMTASEIQKIYQELLNHK
ncbi:MAG: heme ABC exporter ATP-binding protein CcmA [Chlamydiae bacterium]|nr:heme ABC exporter ATP-binding protein CcmA [Chlamydiota bacterium]MBI3276328.1 heme ABC exporter ATP-binding protein CcmA [Chlamydiota bacterium]